MTWLRGSGEDWPIITMTVLCASDAGKPRQGWVYCDEAAVGPSLSSKAIGSLSWFAGTTRGILISSVPPRSGGEAGETDNRPKHKTEIFFGYTRFDLVGSVSIGYTTLLAANYGRLGTT